MTIENQVVSLELAQKLKKSGYPQEGLFWHNEWKTKDKIEIVVLSENGYLMNETEHHYGHFSQKSICVAPTVAELGEALPHQTELFKEGGLFNLMIPAIKDKYGYYAKFTAKKEADARALMWLTLKEKGLL